MGVVSSWDAVVVGAGAAGIFAARELGLTGAKVLVLEQGPELGRRQCPRCEADASCHGCVPCHLLSGWGGAGAFSDGKLSLSPQVGGFLPEFIAPQDLAGLLAEVDGVYRAHGAPAAVHGGDGDVFGSLGERARAADLTLVKNPVRHMGTDTCRQVLGSLFEQVAGMVQVRFGAACGEVLVEGGRCRGVRVAGERLSADAVILAPGRLGAAWVREVSAALGVPSRPNPVDIGVRVECPAPVLAEVTDALYEAKLLYTAPTFGDQVRTFCMNPGGEVVHESYRDCLTVNGHSYAAADGPATNFALLVKTEFTEPFDDPIAYGRSIARLANLLSGGVLVQRFADLAAGRRSTPERIRGAAIAPTLHGATPGDLAFVLPHRHLVDLTEMLHAVDAFCPGVTGPDTFLYGVEVKFYSNRLALDGSLQTPIAGLYGAGDGVGVSRGLMQASASGVWAARAMQGARR
ncbi:MAG: FAD-binding protein [Deferrisomatales bacterium]|nr:FAD-binding protein [Deferrisomatales bacterium]